jgi:poly-gamma-glutamate capsule biosynthesis protein CapA/YwtB (metallophosphatase superfamily)
VLRPVTIAITGDVMLGRLVNQSVAARGFAAPWGNLLPELTRADLVLINLECALTSSTHRWRNGAGKVFYFRADPSVINTLLAARVAFVSLANNHIADFGIEGLLETIEVLDAAGIAHAGAGSTIDAARAPARLSAGPLRISVVAAADYPEAWAAGSAVPGINYIPISTKPAVVDEIGRQLTAARAGADYVIFSIHWGPNMRARPTVAFREFACRVIDLGADLFWGHSAHVVQGVEFYRGKPILYDTGDFVDDYMVDDDLRNDLSGLFLLRVTLPEAMSLDVLPVFIEDMRVNLAVGTERDWFVWRFSALCDEMGSAVVAHDDQHSISVVPIAPARGDSAGG